MKLPKNTTTPSAKTETYHYKAHKATLTRCSSELNKFTTVTGVGISRHAQSRDKLKLLSKIPI